MTKRTGLSFSSAGITMGYIKVVQHFDMQPREDTISINEVGQEISKYREAVEIVKVQLKGMSLDSDILFGHLTILQDETLHETVIRHIEECVNVEKALDTTVNEYTAIFTEMDDAYLRERFVDIQDVGIQIMKILKGVKEEPIESYMGPLILVGNNLPPSEIMKMKDNLVGIIDEQGGKASHVSIIANIRGIVSAVGVVDISSCVSDGDRVIMDSEQGMIVINPENSLIEKYREIIKEKNEIICGMKQGIRKEPLFTADGTEVEIKLNIGSEDELYQLHQKGVTGIGLFRSEFYFMEGGSFPTEEEQYLTYKRLAESCKDEVVLRTFDIGGDKSVSFYKNKEENPALGLRGIRLALKLKNIFKSQLKAILRAAVHGKIKILLPMIQSLEEIRDVKELIKESQVELEIEKKPYVRKIELGIMVETPAAVLHFHHLVKEIDFASIGTNDLTQFILAVDRGNPELETYYSSYHPAVIRGIQTVVEIGANHNKKISICGEMAGDIKGIQLLVGMGLTSFSMPYKDALIIQMKLEKIHVTAAKKLAKQVFLADTTDEVIKIITSAKLE